MKSDPVRAHEKVNADLMHRFRFLITYLLSWLLLFLLIFLSISFDVILSWDDISMTFTDWVLFISFGSVGITLGSLMITGMHYLYERRRRRSVYRKPLSTLVKRGSEVVEENVIGLHNGYIFNVAWVGHVKQLGMGAFVVHVYYKPGPALAELRNQNRSKSSEWSKIRYYDAYLRFYHTNVLFQDSYKTFTTALERLTTQLEVNEIHPSEKESTYLQLIRNVKFEEVLNESLSHL